MKKANNLHLLQITKDLYDVAIEHAAYLCKTGNPIHNSTSEIQVTKRISKLSEKHSAEGEDFNYFCSQGFDEAMDLRIRQKS